MNEPQTLLPAPESTPPRRARYVVVGTLAVLALIVGGAVIASKSGLDRALVRQQLDAMAVQLKARGATQGRDIAFTYGEVEIKGGLSNKHAVVHDPVVAVKPLEAEGFEKPETDEPHTLLITSERLEIYPEAANLSAMRLELPQPVKFSTIEEPGQILLTLSTSTPLALRYANTREDGAAMSRWQFTPPAQTQLSYLREQQGQGAEEQTPTIVPVYETLVMDITRGAGELSLRRDQSGLGEGELELESIRIAPQSAPEAGLITIDKIQSQWSNKRNEQNINVVNSNFSIDRIDADPELLPYAPISAAMEVIYEGAIPTTTVELASMQAQQSAFKLKSFSITTKDATFKATADFSANPEDQLPVGMADVAVTNLPFIVGELKKYDLLSNDREQLFSLLLQQITGTPYADVKDVAVHVERARGGSFKIGKSTFEELFATLLGASLSKGKPPAAVMVPTIPAAKKAQEPISLPEETRG